jgi:hypothetical protein
MFIRLGDTIMDDKQQWLSFALASMHIGAWYGWEK